MWRKKRNFYDSPNSIKRSMSIFLFFMLKLFLFIWNTFNWHFWDKVILIQNVILLSIHPTHDDYLCLSIYANCYKSPTKRDGLVRWPMTTTKNSDYYQPFPNNHHNALIFESWAKAQRVRNSLRIGEGISPTCMT